MKQKKSSMKRPKNTVFSWLWLQGALDMEREKYRKCPVKFDIAPAYVHARMWGYAVNAHLLLEQSLKEIMHARKTEPRQIHLLFSLFRDLENSDKEWLREYYNVFHKSNLGTRSRRKAPHDSLDTFLETLDGPNGQGIMDLRYFLIEESSNEELPHTTWHARTPWAGMEHLMEYMYEIIRGCINVVQYILNGCDDRHDPSEGTYDRQWEPHLTHYEHLKKLEVAGVGVAHNEGYRQLEDMLVDEGMIEPVNHDQCCKGGW